MGVLGVTKLPMITICLILCTNTILLGNKYYFMQSLCNAITKHVNEYNFFSYKGLHIMITYYGIYITKS